MRRVILLLVFIFIVGAFQIPMYSLASEDEKGSTGVYLGMTNKGNKVYYPVMNGYGWNKFDLQSKILILEGMDNGEYLLFLETSKNTKSDIVIQSMIDSLLIHKIDGSRLSDIAEQINTFYRDGANLQIPVIEAFRYTSKRIKGANLQELDNLAAKLRKEYYSK